MSDVGSRETLYDEERARGELVAVCHRLYEKGWVANHDGNVSIRLCEKRILTTPTAVSKGDIRPEMLIVVDREGKKLEGTRKPFSELALHLKIYRERPDARAVVHAHPPTACGFAVAGIPLETTCMPEAVVSLGAEIPLAPLTLPFGEEGAAALNGLLDDADALLLANHGVFTLADDLWTAFYRLELLEHLAKIQLVARQLGHVTRLSSTHIQNLLERRTKAGLGRNAREAKAAPTSTTTSSTASSGVPNPWDAAYVHRIPEGAAPSAWTGGDVVSPCSGEVRATAASSGGSAGSSLPMSAEELQALLKREVQRVLGKG